MENTESNIEIKLDNKQRAYATGKRKNSIARVWVKRGNGTVSINGKSCNIVGLITMDSMIVDITDIEIKNLKIGSYFELINEEFLNNLDMDNSKINIYELFTLMSDRVIRKYKN